VARLALWFAAAVLSHGSTGVGLELVIQVSMGPGPVGTSVEPEFMDVGLVPGIRKPIPALGSTEAGLVLMSTGKLMLTLLSFPNTQVSF
jgi:hypothetical protein